MKKFRLFLTGVISVVMVSSLLAGCGSAASSKVESTPQPSTSSNSQSSFEQLLAMKDKLPLSGIVPLHLDSRKDVVKALPKSQKKNITIGWTGASLGSPFFVGMMDSANAAAKKYGYTINYQNANFDFQKQLTHMDTFVSQKVDIIVLNACDIDASLQNMKSSVAAGIPVIVTGPTAAKADYPVITTFLSGSFEPGFQVGIYTADKLYKEGKTLSVGFTESDIGYADANSRPCGFISGYIYQSRKLAGKPFANKYDAILEGYNDWIKLRDQGKFNDVANGLNLVGYGVGGGTDPASGQKAASDLLTAHPDVEVLMVEEDSQLLGVIAEVKQHNLVPGKDIMIVCGADGTKEAMDFIKAGTVLATASNTPNYDGEGVVELIHKIFEENYDASNLPANSYTPTICINKENVDQMYDPNSNFAKVTPWEIQTIDQYNTANKK